LIKNIIFDFDGVILDSVPTKTEGYRILFKEYSVEVVKKMVEYHELNGGVSRYEKIKYFFNKLLKQDISKDKVQKYADKYSEITKEELTNSKYIISDTVSFIKKNYRKYSMHIASGADERDLIYICDKLNLTKYFLSIYGSPTTKLNIVGAILTKNMYQKEETILIGDSVNDYEVAEYNRIEFYGYNNTQLKKYKYIESYNNFL